MQVESNRHISSSGQVNFQFRNEVAVTKNVCWEERWSLYKCSSSKARQPSSGPADKADVSPSGLEESKYKYGMLIRASRALSAI